MAYIALLLVCLAVNRAAALICVQLWDPSRAGIMGGSFQRQILPCRPLHRGPSLSAHELTRKPMGVGSGELVVCP